MFRDTRWLQSNLARMLEKNLLEPIKDVAVAKLDLDRDKILSCMNVICKSFGLATRRIIKVTSNPVLWP